MATSPNPDEVESDITKGKSAIDTPEESEHIAEEIIDLIVPDPFAHPFLNRIEDPIIEKFMDQIPGIAGAGTPYGCSILIKFAGSHHAHMMDAISEIMDEDRLEPDSTFFHPALRYFPTEILRIQGRLTRRTPFMLASLTRLTTNFAIRSW